MVSLAISTVAAGDSGVLGSARAPRAVAGALAGNSLAGNDSMMLALLFRGSALTTAPQGRRAEHARRVRSPIL
jgi:hypothetical protein